MTETIPSSEFENLIKNSDKPVLVDVFADWCGPCRAIAPVINKMAEELADELRVVKVDRDEADAHGGANNPLLKLMAEKGIRGIPALLLFDGGEYKGSLIGGPRTRQDIQDWVQEKLGRELSPPASSPPLAPYTIPLGPSPDDKEEKMRLVQEFLTASQGAFVPVAERGELSQKLGLAELEDHQLGLVVTTTPQGAQDIADALPDRRILDITGAQVMPRSPGPA